MSSDKKRNVQDIDPIETKEWTDSIDSVVEYEGAERANYLIKQIIAHADKVGIQTPTGVTTPYVNTISPELESHISSDEEKLLQRNTDYMRWNAMAMVMRAGLIDHSLGGHIASYASIATLFEVGLNYFFHAPSKDNGGDLVFFQGHSSPGIYARAFLEDRLTEKQLNGFRREVNGSGLSSYPHPWLMGDFWQFPTVSMGLGPLMSIYQAKFLKYMNHRGLANTEGRTVWTFCGDGEMGEPESLGALNIAGREKLDNLIFVLNCNLQRLDGPVWGNGQVIQEYEGVYRGAGWNVIKVIWGRGWDKLFAKDTNGILIQRISEMVDGEFQLYSSHHDGAFLREHFFGKSPELLELVADMSDEELAALENGGHDIQKVYAAFKAAVEHKGQPTVILTKTIKGYGMGASGEAKNIAHNAKKLSKEDLHTMAKRFDIPLKEDQVEALPYFKPEKTSAESKYLHGQREALGGYLPARHPVDEKFKTPKLEDFSALLQDSGDREFSTTMAFVRVLSTLLKDKTIKDRIVPIAADECRTFGMEGLFRQIGIYSPFGQLYEPEDKKQLMYYREAEKGQLLQEGISESGAMSSWIAAATSYMTSAVTMIPFFIYYSMFGFQRFGDLAWAAGDMLARGFIIGGTAGKTTLNGEGLQHQDGHNLLMFSAVPNCVSYDPTFAYEMVVIIRNGFKRMYEDQENVYFYVTGMNENYHHPAMPEGSEEGIVKGMYLFKKGNASKNKVALLGSGTILNEVIKAAAILEKDYQISADIWSATSFNELHRDLNSVRRYNRLHPDKKAKQSHVEQCLKDHKGPVIAATDYIRLYADQVRAGIKQPYYVLGTDGFGRSDTRDTLRDFFEVDTKNIVYTAIKALVDDGKLEAKVAVDALKKLKIDAERDDPITR